MVMGAGDAYAKGSLIYLFDGFEEVDAPALRLRVLSHYPLFSVALLLLVVGQRRVDVLLRLLCVPLPPEDIVLVMRIVLCRLYLGRRFMFQLWMNL